MLAISGESALAECLMELTLVLGQGTCGLTSSSLTPGHSLLITTKLVPVPTTLFQYSQAFLNIITRDTTHLQIPFRGPCVLVPESILDIQLVLVLVSCFAPILGEGLLMPARLSGVLIKPPAAAGDGLNSRLSQEPSPPIHLRLLHIDPSLRRNSTQSTRGDISLQTPQLSMQGTSPERNLLSLC